MAIKTPGKIGKYSIVSKIAVGGMGVIYKAKHPTLKKDIIIKELTLKNNDSIRERFKREARIMMDFRNDGIVQVYDHFKEGNSYYIAMEYIDGTSLDKLIEKKRYLPCKIAMLIFIEVCKALKYAHDNGVIHRDIKPGNVLISKTGDIKLTDFGIAVSKDTSEQGLTSAGMTLGTPGYMAPEQIADVKSVDKRADIYSMGVMLYIMVTGKIPFPGNLSPELIVAIQKGKYRLPRKINPSVTPLIQKVIKKAMHKKVSRRYKDLEKVISLFSKEHRKFKDQSVINDTLKTYIFRKKSDTISKSLIADFAYRVSGKLKMVLSSLFIIAILAAGGGYYLYQKGYYYEYLKAEQYGALQIALQVKNKKILEETDFIKCQILEKKAKKFIDFKTAPIEFQVEQKRKGRYYLLKSNKIYLPTALYRIQLIKENQVYSQDMFVKPRIMQKAGKKNLTSETALFRFTVNKKSPVKFTYLISDGIYDITNQAELFVKTGGRWFKWDKFSQSKNIDNIFISGRYYIFKISAKGYFNNYIGINLKPYQTSINLISEMIPLPGALYVKSDASGLKILLNNSSNYISGGKKRSFAKIDKSGEKARKLILAPGQYYLTVKDSGNLTKTISVSIISKKSKAVNIKYNKRQKSLQVFEK